jgi:hypothetical protein
LSPEQEAAFEEHFIKCPACLQEIRLQQALPAALHETLAARRGSKKWLIAAAVGAAALLGYTSYLGFVELPNVRARASAVSDDLGSMRTKLDELRIYQEGSRWTGPVSLVFLTGPARGSEARPPIIEVRSGQPFIPLAVVPVLPQAAKPEDRFLFQVRGAEGKTDWELGMSASEINRDLEVAKVVTFLIPALNLSEGRHELVVLRTPGSSSEPVWQTSFQVKTAPSP